MVVFSTLVYTVALPAAESAALVRYHTKRNSSEYVGLVNASEAEGKGDATHFDDEEQFKSNPTKPFRGAIFPLAATQRFLPELADGYRRKRVASPF